MKIYLILNLINVIYGHINIVYLHALDIYCQKHHEQNKPIQMKNDPSHHNYFNLNLVLLESSLGSV